MLTPNRAQERNGKEAQEIVTIEAEAGDMYVLPCVYAVQV